MRLNSLCVGISLLLSPTFLFAGCATSSHSDDQGDGGGGSDATSSVARDGAPNTSIDATTGTDSGSTDSGVVGSGDAGDAPSKTPEGSADPCSGLALCDGFETDTVGAAPSAALWSIVTGCGQNDPASTVTVDNSQQYTGKNSVKVVGGTNTCGPIFSNNGAFKSLGPSIYGRFYARFSVPTQSSHSMFMGLGFETDGGVPAQVNDNLEMTGQYGVYVWNLHDTTLPNTAPSASTPVNTWACFEFHTDATTGDLDTWIGGTTTDTSVAPMSFDPDATAVQAGVNSSWNSYTRPIPFQPTSISFGWVTFGGSAATVWFDDIAIGTTRIGCSP